MASKKFTQFDTANNTSETELSVGVKSGDNFKRLNFLTASTNPTVNDDNSDGYTVGSFWFNASTGVMYICKDSTAGAAVWVTQGGVTDLQGAYDGGNVVNGATVLIDQSKVNVGIGNNVLESSTSEETTAFGGDAGQNSSGLACNFRGSNAGKNNSGNYVNADGEGAGQGNTTNHCNFFGVNAGAGNTTPFGVTVFSPESVPSYADHSAAVASITIANGAVEGQVYIYRNESNNTIGYVIP